MNAAGVVRAGVARKDVVARSVQVDAGAAVVRTGVARNGVVVARSVQVDAGVAVVQADVAGNGVVARVIQVDAVEVLMFGVIATSVIGDGA